MPLPEINPMASRLMGGPDVRERLREQLLARAEQTEDAGYARRLREAADGRRPLRTLLEDPSFRAETGMDDPDASRQVEEAMTRERPSGTPEEVRERARARLQQLGVPMPSADEARALLPDVLELQRRAAEVVAEDRARNWDRAEDDPGTPSRD